MTRLSPYILWLVFLSLPFAGEAQGSGGDTADSSVSHIADTSQAGRYRFAPGIRYPVGTPDNGRQPFFVGGRFSAGQVLRTNDFVSGGRAINFFWNTAIKFGVSSVGNRWQDIVYGMPYYGIGLELTDFGRNRDLGRPISVYLLQGATIASLTRRLDLKYEWNLGVSTGWKAYDPFDNPYNVAIGAETNVQLGYNTYLNWNAGAGSDIKLGLGFTHTSNGGSKLPNGGMNNVMLFVEAAYNFNRRTVSDEYDPDLTPPPYDKHTASEVMFTFTSRQTVIDTVGTHMPSRYLDRKFKVMGFSYTFLFARHYRYRYGAGLDLLYDESSGVTAKRERHPSNGRFYERVYLGKPHDRFSLGVSIRGETLLPGYTIFANLGLQAIHGHNRDSRFYQALGVKIYLKDNLFGTFGLRATSFNQVSYLLWSLGYTIEHRKGGRR